jgi:hypothetical protein
VVAGTWTAVSNGVSKRQAGRWANQDQSQPQPQHQPNTYMPPPPGRYQRAMFQQHTQAPPQYAPPQTEYAQPPAQYAPPSPAPVDPMTARLAHLQQLGQLKAQGILSEAEFQTQKNLILNS